MTEATANGSRPAGWVDFNEAKAVPFERVIEALELSHTFKRYGDEWKGMCPLHGGSKESFGFNEAKRLFHCFGCKRSGNLLDFVKLKVFEGNPEKIKDAARWLVALMEPPADRDPEEATPAIVSVAGNGETLPAAAAVSDESDESYVMTARDRAMCRGVARCIASMFAPLGNVEVIQRVVMQFVEEEIRTVSQE